MRQEMWRTSFRGTITVYLALILLLILSLIFTVIEGARVSTAKVYAERALSTAMDSVWAEYYEPLWKEYHIFGYAAGEGNNRDKAGRMEEKLTEYMTYTLSPNSGLNVNDNKEGTELYDISITSLSVTDQTRLMDYKGELLMKEAVEYMKYHELADGLSLLLNKLSMLEAPKKVSLVYDKKLAAEEELAKADKNILRLMELLDGIKTAKNGIKLDREGRLQVRDYFAKMLCSAPVSMDTVGINHKEVFEAVKNHYINPVLTLSQTNTELEQLEVLKGQLEQLWEELSAAQSSLNAACSRVQKETTEDQEEIEQQSGTINSEVEGLKEQIGHLKHQEQELLEQKAQLTSSAKGSLNRINQVVRMLIPIIEEAELEVEQVIHNVMASSDLIDDFEENLYDEKESLGETIFESLEASLEEMKQYSAGHKEDDSFYEMSDSLLYGRILLIDGEKALQKASDYLETEDYPAALNCSLAAIDELQSYHLSDLSLDYSTLVLDDTKQKNPIDAMSQLLQSGITGLIIDPATIAKNELSTQQLPSSESSLTNISTDFTSMITAFFEDSVLGGDENEMGNLLYDFQNTTELSEGIEKGINLITEHLLFQEYLKEHFESYPTGTANLSGRKPQALNYELEYLLEGKRLDGENLAAVISRIVFVRMILDFVSLLGDKTRCEEAKLAAVAIVGFSGLPMLINVTQAVLLMVWSFAEALVDTCALLLGKEVPILKQKLMLQFPEMFLLNRSFIQTKAESYVSSERVSFSYLDYLRIFLIMKQKRLLIWRSMDLIQENLNLRYEEKIFLRDCLFGFETSADYTMDTKFIAVPFLRKLIEPDLVGYQFTGKAAYSY